MFRSRPSSCRITLEGEPGRSRAMQATTPILVADGLHKRSGALVVLDGVSLSIGQGEALGIVGPNGAGKTTLLSVLSGAQPPNAGSIKFKGDDVTALGAPARCRR